MRFDFSRHRRSLLIAMGVMLILVGAVFGVKTWQQKTLGKAKAEEDEAIRRASSISDEDIKKRNWSVVKAEGGKISDYAFLFGKVDLHPERAMHLHAKFPGIVREVLKATGDKVRPGEVLARIENNVGVQTFDLVSSIHGVVIDRGIARGQAISEQMEAFTIADPTVVMVNLVAYGKDLVKLQKGQQVIVSVNEVEDIKAPITYVSPVLDEETQSAPVLITIENQDLKLKPGQFATGRVIIGEADVAVRVLKNLITMKGEDRGVLFVRTGQEFSIRAVKIGRSDRNFVEVINGLDAGEEYLTAKYSEINAVLDKKSAQRHGT